jgi:hypothetical protein
MQQSVKHCLQQLTFGNINWRYAIFGGKFVEKFRVGNRSQFALADIERRHHGEFSNGRKRYGRERKAQYFKVFIPINYVHFYVDQAKNM